MILHTLNASPTSAAFEQCLGAVAPGDAVLLLGNGVYAALDASDSLARLQATGAALYVLRDDAAAAGVGERLGAIGTVDVDGFVALSEQFPRQLAWY